MERRRGRAVTYFDVGPRQGPVRSPWPADTRPWCPRRGPSNGIHRTGSRLRSLRQSTRESAAGASIGRGAGPEPSIGEGKDAARPADRLAERKSVEPPDLDRKFAKRPPRPPGIFKERDRKSQ